MCGRRPYVIELYETPHGDKPVLRWIKEDLSVRQRRALGYAVYRLLQRYGVGVCDAELGRQLGGGLFELRLRLRAHADGESALLGLFCHAAGARVILLLGGYDKGKDGGRRRQSHEIRVARQRLCEHLRRQQGADRDSPRLEYNFYVILRTSTLGLHMTDFEGLLHQMEEEAEAEGPAGRAHFDELRDRYDLVVQIIDRRRELHLTQQQVAAASGLHQSVVSRIEQGVANPTARTLAVLARALDAKLTLTGRQA